MAARPHGHASRAGWPAVAVVSSALQAALSTALRTHNGPVKETLSALSPSSLVEARKDDARMFVGLLAEPRPKARRFARADSTCGQYPMRHNASALWREHEWSHEWQRERLGEEAAAVRGNARGTVL